MTETPKDPTNTTVTSPAGTPNTDPTENRVPQSRFNEVNNARLAAEAKVAAFEAAEAKRQEAESLAKGEYTKVIDDLKPKAERTAALEKALADYLEVELTDVPEDKRDLVPNLDTTAKLAWLKAAKLAGLFGTPRAPNLDAGALGTPTNKALKLSADEQRMAQISGMSAAQYSEYKQKSEAVANTVELPEGLRPKG